MTPERAKKILNDNTGGRSYSHQDAQLLLEILRPLVTQTIKDRKSKRSVMYISKKP